MPRLLQRLRASELLLVPCMPSHSLGFARSRSAADGQQRGWLRIAASLDRLVLRSERCYPPAEQIDKAIAPRDRKPGRGRRRGREPSVRGIRREFPESITRKSGDP